MTNRTSDALIVAVVDDNPDVRTALARLLRSYGHEVHAFASAEEYLVTICQEDCAILDIQLPGISGLQLEGHLRGIGSDMPVVFVTGLDDPTTRQAVLKTGMPYFNKPFDDDGLLATIARVTHRRAS